MPELHRVYLGLGANLGDRQSNLVQAMQHIRARAAIEQISACYETRPVGYLEQPDFLNLACAITTELSPHELLRFLKQVERRMGREPSFRNAPRPIDIDILFYDDLVLESEALTIPHPRLNERAFVLVPLAEIAAALLHPSLNLTVAELLQRVDRAGVTRVPRGLRVRPHRDLQQAEPAIHVSLSRAGVTGLRRIIRLSYGGHENLFYAEIDLFADLTPGQMGVHMSRFSDVLEEVAEEITLEKSPNIETLAERIARQVVERQRAIRSEVHVRAVYPMEKIAPLSGRKMQELYTLIGIALSTQERCKHVVGAEADGMTVCPCAQDMVREHSMARLLEEGFSPEEARRALDAIPIASHNQRGRGTLMIGSEQEVRAENLVEIIEASMSSETYDLLKRPDEFFVVNKAHRNPRFVEDVVREMLQNVVDIYPDLPDTAFVLARQENFESIHKHNAFAERYGTLGEVRREILAGEHLIRHTSLQEWLER
jgi:GTP cyclohydrolase-4